MKNPYIKALFFLACSRGWWRCMKLFCKMANSGQLVTGDSVVMRVKLVVGIPEGIEREGKPSVEVFPGVRSNEVAFFCVGERDDSERRVGFCQPEAGSPGIPPRIRDAGAGGGF